MKKKTLILLALIIFVAFSFGDYSYNEDFIDTAIATITTGVTKVNVTDFTSNEIRVSRSPVPSESADACAITITFTRATGSASTVDFAFEASYDGGVTWATFEGVEIKIASNYSVVSGTTVRVLKTFINIPGVSHIRLKSVKNNDAASITAVNATLSL